MTLPESEIISIAKNNEWTLRDILYYYMSCFNDDELFNKLAYTGTLKRWSKDCKCTISDIVMSITDKLDENIKMSVHPLVSNAFVRCVLRLDNCKRLFLDLEVS